MTTLWVRAVRYLEPLEGRDSAGRTVLTSLMPGCFDRWLEFHVVPVRIGHLVKEGSDAPPDERPPIVGVVLDWADLDGCLCLELGLAGDVDLVRQAVRILNSRMGVCSHGEHSTISVGFGIRPEACLSLDCRLVLEGELYEVSVVDAGRSPGAGLLSSAEVAEIKRARSVACPA